MSDSALLYQTKHRAWQYRPYEADAIVALIPVETKGHKTISCDKHWRVYFDDEFMFNRPVEESSCFLLHECDHLVLRHHRRGTVALQSVVGCGLHVETLWDLWNQATDAKINQYLRADGVPLVEGMVTPESLGFPRDCELCEEELFRALVERKVQEQQQQQEARDDDGGEQQPEEDDSSEQDSGAGGEGDESGEGHDDQTAHGGDKRDLGRDGGAEDDDDGPEGDDGGAGEGEGDSLGRSGDDDASSDRGRRGMGEDEGEPGAAEGHVHGDHANGRPTVESDQDGDHDTGGHDTGGDEGTSEEAEGSGGDDELEPGESGSCSDGRPRSFEQGEPDEDEPGMDESDQEQIIHRVANRALSRGDTGSNAKRWAEKVINPPVDPCQKLMQLVKKGCDLITGVGEPSYRRPNRFNTRRDMSLPSNFQPVPRITMILDTSGSMTAHYDLAVSLGMVLKVLNGFRIRDGIKCITGDTSGRTKQVCLADPSKIDLRGGGGTNMANLVADAEQDKPKPQMIIVCTDGGTPWPEEKPSVPTIVCLSRTKTDWRADPLPDWLDQARELVEMGNQ